MYKHILIPTEGSELSKKAVRAGVSLARALNARVTAITVIKPLYFIIGDGIVRAVDLTERYDTEEEARAAENLAFVQRVAHEAQVPCEVIIERSEHPYERIVATAEKCGCDLIFMASHGRSGVKALLLGSETSKVLTHTKTHVLVCR